MMFSGSARRVLAQSAGIERCGSGLSSLAYRLVGQHVDEGGPHWKVDVVPVRATIGRSGAFALQVLGQARRERGPTEVDPRGGHQRSQHNEAVFADNSRQCTHVIERRRSARVRTGSDWMKESIGTSAIGTAVIATDLSNIHVQLGVRRHCTCSCPPTTGRRFMMHTATIQNMRKCELTCSASSGRAQNGSPILGRRIASPTV
eukprot:SAG11_NODE_316_length_10846_cov_8.188239_9_plen_203_part_00